MRSFRRWLRHNSLAVLGPSLAYLLTVLLQPVHERFPFAFFLIAVTVSGLHRGLRTGFVATLYSALLLAVHHQQRLAHGLPVADADFIPRLSLFTLVGILAGYLGRECGRAVEALVRVHGAISGIGDAVLFTDERGRVTFLSDEAERLTGYPRAEALGLPLGRVFHAIHEDGRGLIKDPVAEVLVGRGRAGSEEATLLVARNGEERPVAYRAEALRDVDDDLRGVVVLARDLSEQRRVEKELEDEAGKYHALAAGTSAGLLLLDASGRCTFHNPAARDLCGLSPDEAPGDGWARHLHPEDRRVAAEWVEAARRDRPFEKEFRFQLPGGLTRWVRLRAAPARANGDRVGHVGTLEDVGAARQLEQQVAEFRLTEQELTAAAQQREEEFGRQFAELGEVNARLREQLADAGRVEQTLRAELEELEARHRSAEEEHRRRQHAEEALRQQVEEGRQTEDGLRQQFVQMQQAADDLRRQIDALTREKLSLEGQLVAHAQADQAFRAQLDQLRADHERATAEQQQRLSELVRAEAEARIQLTQHQQAEQALREDRDRWQAERRRAEEELGRCRAELEEARARWQQAQEERQRLEQALAAPRPDDEASRRQQEFLTTVLEQSGTGLAAWDASGRLCLLNRAAREYLGLPGADLAEGGEPNVALRDAETGTPLPPDVHPLTRARRGQSVHDLVAVCEGPDRSRVLKFDGSPLPGAAGTVLVLRDVSADKDTEADLRSRLRAEQRQVEETCRSREQFRQQLGFLHAVTASLGEAVLAVGPSGDVTFLNPAAERLLGWAEADLLGRKVGSCLHVPEGEPVTDGPAERFLQALAAGAPLSVEAVPFRRPDGSTLSAVCTVAPLPENGQAGGAVVTVRAWGGQPPARPETTENGRGDLVAHLADVLRKRLASLDEAWQVLGGSPPGDRAQQDGAREVVGRQLEQLTLFADGLWDLTRAARGDLRLSRQPVRLDHVINAAVAAVQANIKARRLRLVVALPLGPERLLADVAGLARALAYLLEQVAAGAAPGDVVDLTALRRSETIELRLRAEGNTYAPEAPGPGGDSGVGFWLARKLVEMHDGSLTFSSAAGGGPTVTVRLPLLPKETLLQPPAPVESVLPEDGCAEAARFFGRSWFVLPGEATPAGRAP